MGDHYLHTRHQQHILHLDPTTATIDTNSGRYELTRTTSGVGGWQTVHIVNTATLHQHAPAPIVWLDNRGQLVPTVPTPHLDPADLEALAAALHAWQDLEDDDE